MEDGGIRTSGRASAPSEKALRPTRPPSPSRRIDALLDSATRPLRRVLPHHDELPTRRLPLTELAAPTAPTAPTAPDGSNAPDDRDEPDDRNLRSEPRHRTGRAVPAANAARAGVPARERGAAPKTPGDQATPATPATAQQQPGRRPAQGSDPCTLRRALLAAAASTVAPGSGHLLLRRRRTGALLLGLFVFGGTILVVLAATLPRAELLENLLSTRVLIVAVLLCLAAAAAWAAVIVHTYLVGRPRQVGIGHQVLGAVTVAALCLVVAAPLGLAAHLADSQRGLLNTLFPSAGGGAAAAAAAISKPRLNILLVGSDAGPDRTGTRTDTMMVASVDTRTGRTTLFGLPRNIGYARFPPRSPMAAEFPDGFHDAGSPLSGDYLLNAVYAYGHSNPDLAPKGPTRDPGLNLLQSSISYMLGLPIDYQIVVDMAGFASLIDALGGLLVNVGPERIPIGGIGPRGQAIRPEGYIRPGLQQLSGKEALAFARSRTGSTDYVRMGRQRCLIQYVLDQKSPTDLLTNFQAIARATTDSITTDIPREVLPALVKLAGGSGTLALESVAFDPDLPDPDARDGRFDTFDPNVPYMREVVREAINRSPVRVVAPTPSRSETPSATSTKPQPGDPAPTTRAGDGSRASTKATPRATQPTAAPQSLARSCQ